MDNLIERIDQLLIGEAEDSDKIALGSIRSQIASLRDKLKHVKDAEGRARIKGLIAKREEYVAKLVKKQQNKDKK
jgi:hypothetical protein